jgi:diamine N-acetyltransferase
MSTTQKPLEELVTELPPDLRAQVREYVEYLLSLPEQPPETSETAQPGPEAWVSLREITEETVREICKLTDTLTPPKKYMVAPNAVSIAQAYFSEYAWFRAIYADDTPVGFVMLYDDPEGPEYFLWRYMIAGPHHGKGFGRRGIELLVEYVKTRPGAEVLETSCGQGPGSPEKFYRSLGFERNGKMHGQEVGLSLVL